jgi:ubiquitin thioesterase OTU1
LRHEAWGGAIELGVLAKRLELELVAVEVRTSKCYVFPSTSATARRGFLVFDGVHYDPIHAVDEAGRPVQTNFTLGDDSQLSAVVAIAAAMRDSRQFVDATRFTLLCTSCNAGVIGEAEAREHASATGHTNFAEHSKAQNVKL